MQYATAEAVAFAEQEHAKTDYLLSPEEFAARLGVRVIIGRENFATDGPPAIISQTPDSYAPRQRFTIFHELAHVLVQRSGLEADVMAEVDPEDAEVHLEAVINHITGVLLIPDSLIRHYVTRYGFTPEALFHIRIEAGASLAATIRRGATWEPERQATIFVATERYILDVASCDPWNRIRRYDRIPDARAAFPQADLLSLVSLKARTLGILQH